MIHARRGPSLNVCNGCAAQPPKLNPDLERQLVLFRSAESHVAADAREASGQRRGSSRRAHQPALVPQRLQSINSLNLDSPTAGILPATRLSQPRPPPEAAPASDPAWSDYVATSCSSNQGRASSAEQRYFKWLESGEMTINIPIPAEGASSSSSSPQYIPVPPQARQPQASANEASQARNHGEVIGP